MSFDRPKRRHAEYIQPPQTLKAKVGSGGLSENILQKAQALIENSKVDFIPLAEMYLDTLEKNIENTYREVRSGDFDKEYVINSMLYPAIQLKSNGGMFRYPLISSISDHIIRFLEVIDFVDLEVLEIMLAFHASIRAIVAGRIEGDGGEHGVELTKAIHEACLRYLDKYPDNREEVA